MHYLLSIYSDESARANATPEDGARMMAAYDAFTSEVKSSGAFVAGDGLQPTSTATTVRVRDGETLLTDGPFAETREQLGGYYLLDCADLDDAVRWAAKIPAAQFGSIEVRPVMDYDAVGSTEHADSGAARG
ncbi:MAG TPA: YciI family protein [Solirubrobacteraceae bacterium]|nr:YciI family protein [Solirubrobacteraceae bacterium]